MVTLGSLGGEMVNIMVQNARDVGSIPALYAIFPIFITPTTESILFGTATFITFEPTYPPYYVLQFGVTRRGGRVGRAQASRSKVKFPVESN